jgi:hypothetical protein
MFKILRFKILIIFILTGCFKTYSQEDSLIFTKGFLDSLNIEDLFKQTEKKSFFKVQTSYLSNYVFGGRKDSLALPYFTPSIEYNHKSGLYASASLGLLPNSQFKNDFISIDAGYIFDTSHHFGCSLFANKLFYSDSSKNVQSNVTFTSGAVLNYYTKIANLSSVASVMFGSKTDFSLSLSLDHSFEFENDTSSYALSVTPTLSAYFGSTGFYQSTKSNRRVRNFPAGTTFALVSPEKFQMLSYEFSLPINYDRVNWGLFITPTYAIAVNPVITSLKITLPNGGILNRNESVTEKISNSFFFDLGLYYKF